MLKNDRNKVRDVAKYLLKLAEDKVFEFSDGLLWALHAADLYSVLGNTSKRERALFFALENLRNQAIRRVVDGRDELPWDYIRRMTSSVNLKVAEMSEGDEYAFQRITSTIAAAQLLQQQKWQQAADLIPEPISDSNYWSDGYCYLLSRYAQERLGNTTPEQFYAEMEEYDNRVWGDFIDSCGHGRATDTRRIEFGKVLALALRYRVAEYHGDQVAMAEFRERYRVAGYDEMIYISF